MRSFAVASEPRRVLPDGHMAYAVVEHMPVKTPSGTRPRCLRDVPLRDLGTQAIVRARGACAAVLLGDAALSRIHRVTDASTNGNADDACVVSSLPTLWLANGHRHLPLASLQS